MLVKILLAGDGGQGVQTMADIIARAAFTKDFFVSYVPNYGLEQRGGTSLAFIQISDHEVVYPKFSTPDILMIMSDASRERVMGFKHQSVKVVDVKDYLVNLENNQIKLGSYNIFFLGILAKILAENKIALQENIFNALKNRLEQKPGWQENKKIYLVSSGIK